MGNSFLGADGRDERLGERLRRFSNGRKFENCREEFRRLPGALALAEGASPCAAVTLFSRYAEQMADYARSSARILPRVCSRRVEFCSIPP